MALVSAVEAPIFTCMKDLCLSLKSIEALL